MSCEHQRCEHVPVRSKNIMIQCSCMKTAVVQRNEKWYCSIHDPVQVRVSIPEKIQSEKIKRNFAYYNEKLAFEVLVLKRKNALCGTV